MNDRQVRNQVLPIVAVSPDSPGSLKYEALFGTGFIVGPTPRLITSHHVLAENRTLVALQVIDAEWRLIELGQPICHPTEDIAVVPISPPVQAEPFLRLSVRSHFGSGAYSLWGYPEDVLYDGMAPNSDGRVLQLPDLIFNRGYIRRRVNFRIPGLRGTNFYELSEVAGAGCSGAPLVTKLGDNWQVAGVYVGERTVEEAGKPLRAIGYALRFDSIAKWFQQIGMQVLSNDDSYS